MKKQLEPLQALPAATKPHVNGKTEVPSPKPSEMSLEKAKRLIRKTSLQHEGLFRRLAK